MTRPQSIDQFLSLSFRHRESLVAALIREDGCFTEKTQSFESLAKATIDAALLLASYRHAPLFTNYGIRILFEPDQRMIAREVTFLNAFLKYAAHFVTNRDYENEMPVIYYSKSKHDHLHKLLPVLIDPDRIVVKRANIHTGAHFKYYSEEPGNQVFAVFSQSVKSAGDTPCLQVIAFMPDKNKNFLDKKISGDSSEYIELSPEEMFQQYSNP